MPDPLTLAVAIGAPLLTAAATLVWQLAHASRTREEVRDAFVALRQDIERGRQHLADHVVSDDARHDEAQTQRHADAVANGVANGAFGAALARIEGMLAGGQGYPPPPRPGSRP